MYRLVYDKTKPYCIFNSYSLVILFYIKKREELKYIIKYNYLFYMTA